ncbi:uncharacterized protein N7518_010014 [Penicillium psychrosexuale]|uniref:uncharacterized protein n=1 Tax=Penicillium psychrosexuale TaxID=1002107 RepID=UPI0025459589|nr:uncharacterized protein N7518_010014 [Penicillium psychrosexuale]KAJ5781531.1 hypothetical protein N7518_010014 [Penicillium psychrosexuale]
MLNELALRATALELFRQHLHGLIRRESADLDELVFDLDTQGRKHQTNLERRAGHEDREGVWAR